MSTPLTTPTPLEPRSVDAGRGIAWWGEAWALFARNPACGSCSR
jgi:hypothetical protein